MPKVSHVVEIARSPQAVFKVLLDANRIKEWAPVVTGSASSAPSLKESTPFRISADLKPVGGPKLEFDNIVAKLVDEREIVWKQTKGTMKKLEWRFILEPANDSKATNLSLTIDYEMPYSFFGSIMDKLKMNRVIDSACRLNLEGLKKKLESDA
jgi:ribosome-associated toxin RatA of RatAB toxin-antitoxin module